MKSTPPLPSPVTAPWGPRRNQSQSPSSSPRWSQSQSGHRIQAAPGLGPRQKTASCRGLIPSLPCPELPIYLPAPSTSWHVLATHQPGCSHKLSPSGKPLSLACCTPTPGAGLGGQRTAPAVTSPLPWGRHVTPSQGSPEGVSFPVCKMGEVRLGDTVWVTGGEAEIPREILKVQEVVN